MGTLLFAASFSVNALTSNDFDPRDPAIWQEETATPYPLAATTCEVRHHPDCATWEDENPTFSVNASGEISGAYKICTKVFSS